MDGIKYSRKELIDVFNETIDCIENGCYRVEGEKIDKLLAVRMGESLQDALNVDLEDSCVVNINTYDREREETYICDVKVVNEDCLYVADRYEKEGFNVCLLNMACTYQPGGGVLKGSMAQEEELFRRTTLPYNLYSLHPMGKDLGFETVENCYPLTDKVIYTDLVEIFREGADKGYAFMENTPLIDVISAAAVRKPVLVNGKLSKKDEEEMRKKIRVILGMPHDKGDDVLILSAFGCGAYGNPPREIARLFKEEIIAMKAYTLYNHIVFAILDDKNSNGNYAVFKEILETKDYNIND